MIDSDWFLPLIIFFQPFYSEMFRKKRDQLWFRKENEYPNVYTNPLASKNSDRQHSAVTLLCNDEVIDLSSITHEPIKDECDDPCNENSIEYDEDDNDSSPRPYTSDQGKISKYLQSH